MTHRSLFASGVIAFALALPVAASAQHGGRIELPAVPAGFTAPEGNIPYLQTRAYGTQNYFCLPAGWKFFGPEATLYPQNAPIQVATHFLSPSAEVASVARPTWQHANDGSKVWGKVYGQPLTDSNYVAPGAIPWLLLEVVAKEEGPIGDGLLTRTTFIHRVNTEGGVAPATGCNGTTDVGKIALVPYSTDYFFYRAEQ